MIEVPRVSGDYKLIYKPQPDRFPGPDSEHLKTGELYGDWIANDHTFIRDRHGRWHAFGIVNPVCPGLHEGAWMSFHAVSPAASINPGEPWDEHPKVLVPADRPGERYELYAPYVIEHRGQYHMFYGPNEMRRAISDDLFQWRPQGICFAQDGAARDPCVVNVDGTFFMVYCAGTSVFLRTSNDLRAWSDPPTEIFRMRRPGWPESPVLVRRDSGFYLFWCIYDGTNSYYDNRTFVHWSDAPHDFTQAEELTAFEAHAPELFVDDAGQWYISSAEWPRRGVSVARLDWGRV